MPENDVIVTEQRGQNNSLPVEASYTVSTGGKVRKCVRNNIGLRLPTKYT